MNELAIKPSDNISVIAETPDEMKAANTALIQWCDNKIRELRVDHIELDAAYKSAVEKKWKSSVLKRHAEQAKKRIIFYGKIRTALKAGFYIVPNFPVDVFAIRSDKAKPLKLLRVEKQYGKNAPYVDKTQAAQSLDQGSGNYVSPEPKCLVSLQETFQENNSTYSRWKSWASEWKDVDFPLVMAKPRIMEAVGRAMEIKLFDDFGILSNANVTLRRGDPIIVGRIRDPRSTTYNLRVVSFIIAWSLDTSAL